MACDRIILWDIDGVLISHHPTYPSRDWRRGLWEKGWLEAWESFQESDLWRACLTRRDRAVEAAFSAFIRREGFSADAVEAVSCWLDGNTVPSEPALACLRGFSRRGYTCGLASNQDAARAARLSQWLAETGLGHLPLFLSCDVGAAKPEAAFFGAVAEKLGKTGDAIMLLDDRPENIEAARTAGWSARHVTPDFAWQEFSKEFGDV